MANGEGAPKREMRSMVCQRRTVTKRWMANGNGLTATTMECSADEVDRLGSTANGEGGTKREMRLMACRWRNGMLMANNDGECLTVNRAWASNNNSNMRLYILNCSRWFPS